jgi:acyl-CoA thioesterase II
MPDVPDPDSLPGDPEAYAQAGAEIPKAVRKMFERERTLEIRPVDLSRYSRHVPMAPQQYVWIRAIGPLPDDQALHCAALAYLSDMTLLDTALAAHGRVMFDSSIQIASLDHALWFHRPFRADEWLLYAQDSPTAQHGRGLTRGLIFKPDGTLVASVAQEGSVRERR